MASQADYTASANAIMAVFDAWIRANVPAMFQSEALTDMLALSGAAAQASVDAVDKERLNE